MMSLGGIQMANPEILYLSRGDVEAIGLSMAEIISGLEKMFVEKGRGEVEMPPKPGIHPRQDAFIHAMPAYVPGSAAAGIKWVSGYPDNPMRGLPYISGLLVLNDPGTGFPLAVMDCTWITAKRTGAATAVAAKLLARPESSQIGIIACGVQGRSNLEALACCFVIEKVRAFDIDSTIAHEYAEEMSRQLSLDVEVVGSAEEVVAESDIVVTSGPILLDPTPTIEAGWLRCGAFACPLDFDSYWTGGALRAADKIATDDLQQMEYYRMVGYFSETPEAYADLGQIASGQAPERENEDEVVICLNLGLAAEDMVTAKSIYARAMELGIGRLLPS
jgi:ornithine cyclodeaminase/alanine dehydrogenase